MGKIRTFIAVDISTGIQRNATKAISRLAAMAPDYNWVDNNNMHITLNFLGDVDESEIPAVCRVAKDAVNQFGSFELSINGLGCFPGAGKPRVVWMGVETGSHELIQLNEKLTTALLSMGFPKDRNEYRPHLTLGRVRRGKPLSPQIAAEIESGRKANGGETIVDEVVVYSSFLDRGGPTYTAMSRIKLL